MNCQEYNAKYHTNFLFFIKKSLNEIKKYKLFIKLLLIRSISKKYQGSALGMLWSVIAPLLTLMALAIVFPLIMKFRIENYIVYLFSGFMGWHMISSAFTAGGSALLSREPLLKKQYIPKLIFPIVVILNELFNFFVTFIALLLVVFILGDSININVPLLLFTFVITSIFCLSIALSLSVLTVYFRDLKQIVSIGIQAFFYLTPILYVFEKIPDHYQFLMYFNPFYHYINLFHLALYDDSLFTINALIIPSILSLFLLVLSLYIFMKLEKNIVYRF